MAKTTNKRAKPRRQFTLYFNDNPIEDATFATLESVPSGSRRQQLLHDLLEAYAEGRVAGLQPRRRKSSTPSTSSSLPSPKEHALESPVGSSAVATSTVATPTIDEGIGDLFEGIEL